MSCNFIPLDIKLDLWEDLPASFQLKQNRSLVRIVLNKMALFTLNKLVLIIVMIILSLSLKSTLCHVMESNHWLHFLQSRWCLLITRC